jgi:transcriptional antiterminator RfaH
MQITAEKQWYLVQCKPRQDMRALENLQRQQFECLLPTLQVERVCNGAVCTRREPLFPGYLFIELDTVRDNWLPIRSTRGVSQIVRFDNQPLPVPRSIIENIRTRTATPCSLFKMGERVELLIPGGEGIDALFTARKGTERVILLLNMLHRELLVSVPITQVRRLA